ncbi:MAG: hypothetical protein HZC47_09860 [Methanobacterium sp.]|uniref:hypothetical protein n=1 Tax=Methanobacterium sp. TaxID=2164 RepID=UPI003D6529B0|nr:hypothetical protein [Methanobacterium sp.]
MENNNDLYAEKAGEELKSRIEWFKEALQDDEKREEIHDSVQGSEILVRLEIFLPSDDPDNFADGLYLYIDNSGLIVDADYYFRKTNDGAVTRLEGEELQIVKDLFQDAFSLEIE